MSAPSTVNLEALLSGDVRLGPTLGAGFDAVIDVRSPAEFAEDHVPGAINLPVLSNAERAEVGTLYVQTSKFAARKRGAALVSANIARHLAGPLASAPAGWRPLVYCWRGGQRSGAMALVLAQVGWPAAVLAGGYRAYRREVAARLYAEEDAATFPWRLALLDGLTGCGKTEMLAAAAAQGVQTLDLEALAAHRGSVFGADDARAQPSQKAFEGALLARLRECDPARPVLVEAEANAIGARRLPPALWRAMAGAPVIEATATPEARAAYVLERYQALADDRPQVVRLLEGLLARHGRERVAAWRRMAQEGRMAALVADLLERHYDPAYRHARRRLERAPERRVTLEDLSAASIEAAAAEVRTWLQDRETQAGTAAG